MRRLTAAVLAAVALGCATAKADPAADARICEGQSRPSAERVIDACATLLKADERKDDRGRAHLLNNRGVAFGAKDWLSLAAKDFSDALTVAPAEASLYANRAAVFARRGDFSRALADLNDAIALDPVNTERLLQ